MPPLFSHELEPGQAIKASLDFIHPFTASVSLPEILEATIQVVCKQPSQVNEGRASSWRFGARKLVT